MLPVLIVSASPSNFYHVIQEHKVLNGCTADLGPHKLQKHESNKLLFINYQLRILSFGSRKQTRKINMQLSGATRYMAI